jgi:acetyl esterase/lipase
MVHNKVQIDCAMTGLISHLPSDYQIIVATYPEAPENRFPAPVLHLQETISWLVDHPDQYKIDPCNIILSGYSCGGSMLIPLALYFANKSYHFKSLISISPIFDYSGDLQKD